MLRFSTSFHTRPMPMKMAMSNPKIEIDASPRSLMILTSCPAVSSPIRYEAPSRRAGPAGPVAPALLSFPPPSGHPADDGPPAGDVERDHAGQTPRRDEPALGENRHAAAERLGIREHVRAEEHGTAAVAQ